MWCILLFFRSITLPLPPAAHASTASHALVWFVFDRQLDRETPPRSQVLEVPSRKKKKKKKKNTNAAAKAFVYAFTSWPTELLQCCKEPSSSTPHVVVLFLLLHLPFMSLSHYLSRPFTFCVYNRLHLFPSLPPCLYYSLPKLFRRPNLDTQAHRWDVHQWRTCCGPR